MRSDIVKNIKLNVVLCRRKKRLRESDVRVVLAAASAGVLTIMFIQAEYYFVLINLNMIFKYSIMYLIF